MGLLSLFTSLLKENHFLFLSAVCWMGPRELMMRSVPPCKKSSNKRKEALLQFNCCLSSSHWHLIINLHCHCGTDYLNLFCFFTMSHFSKCKYNLTHLIKIFKVYFFLDFSVTSMTCCTFASRKWLRFIIGMLTSACSASPWEDGGLAAAADVLIPSLHVFTAESFLKGHKVTCS